MWNIFYTGYVIYIIGYIFFIILYIHYNINYVRSKIPSLDLTVVDQMYEKINKHLKVHSQQ